MLTLYKTSYIVYLLLICYSQYVASSKEEDGYSCVSDDGSQKICKKGQEDCHYANSALQTDGICPDDCETAVCYDPLLTAPIKEPKIVRTVVYSNRTGGEISRQKCKEHAGRLRYVVFREYVNATKCIFTSAYSDIIFGGEPAIHGEFPHMALIGYQTGTDVEWSCGGTLISDQFVLTAAHCLTDIAKGTAKLVKLGVIKKSDSDGAQVIPVSEVIFYPDYDNTKYHDIGLIKLARQIHHNAEVRPACLHTERNIPYEKATVAGWGNTRSTSAAGSDDLLKVVLEFFDTQKCNATFKREINKRNSALSKGVLDDFMICAGSKKEIKDSCQGDSGGPLMVYHKSPKEIICMHNILGVVSTGKLCGLAPNVPGIYTRVSAYIKWIEDIVWPE